MEKEVFRDQQVTKDGMLNHHPVVYWCANLQDMRLSSHPGILL